MGEAGQETASQLAEARPHESPLQRQFVAAKGSLAAALSLAEIEDADDGTMILAVS